MRLLLSTYLLVAAASASPKTSPPQRRSVVHERRNANQRPQWMKRDRMPATDVFQMRIGLTQQNDHRGYELLMDVSDPTSPTYGQHWTPEKIAETFAPSDDTVNAAKTWLVETGIAEDRITHSPGKGWLVFHPTVEEAEELLQTEFWLYEHEEGSLGAGVDEYSIPHHLAEHIDFVYPAVVLGEIKSSTVLPVKPRAEEVRRQLQDNATCAEVVTPDCIAAFYNIPPADKAHPNNSMGLFEQGSWYQNADLDLFFANYAPTIPQGTRPQNLSVDQSYWFYDSNVTTITEPDEADLDLDVAFPIVYPQSITVFQVDDVFYNDYSATTTLGIFNTFLDALDASYCNYSAYGETGDSTKYDPIYPDNNKAVTPEHLEGFDPGTYKLPTMCGTYKPTNVISMSYGRVESTFTQAYQKRQCDEFMKLGLQGVSVIVASGDSGVLASQACTVSNSGTFWVQSASNCPYVTSVGATQLLSNGTETAVQADNWASGGGFSQYFAAPDYQQSAVATYLADHYPTAQQSYFNASGRGVPDISALGANIAVAVSGELTTTGGTSASAPIFAAMLNRVNEERLAAGKGPVGFVNPVLYATPRLFRDITTGNNDICGIDGFEAVEGWDPVTGLGTPDYPTLLETFLALP